MSGGTLSSANSVCGSLVFLWLFSSDWFLMLFCASCLTFTIFSQAVLANKKSFQQERLCIKRLLFTKSSVWVTWALSALPYCNTIWNSVEFDVFCLLRLVACSVFLFTPFGSFVLSWRVFGSIWPIFLSPARQHGTEIISYSIFQPSHLNFFCAGPQQWRFSIWPIFLFPTRQHGTEIQSQSLHFFLFLFFWPSWILHQSIVLHWYWFFLYIQLFQLRLWDSHRVSHGVCSLF